MDRLRKESEIFAGQIIEQDEEMEALKNELDERDREIASLKNQLKTHEEQLSTNRADAKEVVRLRAELDELQESNRTHLMELRDLRRKLRDTKFDSNKMADLEIELSQTKRALEEQKTRSVVTERVDPKLKQELADARRARERAEKTIRNSWRRSGSHRQRLMPSRSSSRTVKPLLLTSRANFQSPRMMRY
jgi:chromosome segregation ATPase